MKIKSQLAITIITGIVFSTSLLSTLSKFNILFGIFSIFNFQYLIFSLLILPLLFFVKNTKIAKIFSLITILINIAILIPFVGSSQSQELVPNNNSLSIISINVSESTDSYDGLVGYLENKDVDVVLIQELRQDLIDLLNDKLSTQYPYNYYVPSRFTLGLGFLSKIPLENPTTINFESSEFSRKYLQTAITKDGKTYNIINLHTLPPTRLGWFGQKNTEIEEYIRLVSANDSYIAVGDFNTTPWTWPISSKKNSNIGLPKFNLSNSSWKLLGGLIKIPYDYPITSGNLEIENFRTLDDFGSDHLPVFMTVSSK